MLMHKFIDLLTKQLRLYVNKVPRMKRTIRKGVGLMGAQTKWQIDISTISASR